MKIQGVKERCAGEKNVWIPAETCYNMKEQDY